MRAFLSHSSRDKGFVERVTETLRPGSFHLDSVTFDAGALNSAAIVSALAKSDLFCLFLSSSSVQSPFVEFESLFSLEFFARGGIKRVLVFTLDEDAFREASSSTRFFNILRRPLSPESTARQIDGMLISLSGEGLDHPFIGRETELLTIEQQLNDPIRPHSKALFISGNIGSGRRTTAMKIYLNQYPHVNRVFPSIKLDEYFGLSELYRQILGQLRPTITGHELRIYINAFEISSEAERKRQVAQLLNSLLVAREAAFMIDNGGLLRDDGSFTSELDGVIAFLDTRPHPPIAFISRRMMPSRFRRDDVSYLALKTLDASSGLRLMSQLIKQKNIAATAEQIEELVSLADGHPYNFYQIVGEIDNIGTALFLADTTDFVEWKHKRSSEYLDAISLSATQSNILGILRLLLELDLETIVIALRIPSQDARAAMLELVERHIVEAYEGLFSAVPALKVAIERDLRIEIPATKRAAALKTIATTLSVRIEEGRAPVALLDAAVLATLDVGNSPDAFIAAFLLPSHHLRVAIRKYDEKKFKECIKFARDALLGADRLSVEGFDAACSYICLAAARDSKSESAFPEGLAKLKAVAASKWQKSNIEFLQGFKDRLSGRLLDAEERMRKAIKLAPRNKSAIREIAGVLLALGEIDEAEEFARDSYGQAPRNPYFVDILLAVLIKKKDADQNISEIEALFSVLEAVGEDDVRSFYSTRRAEYELNGGNVREAVRLSEIAVKKTPRLFEPRRIYVRALLADGNKTKAGEILEELRRQVNPKGEERRTNFRALRETEVEYYMEMGRYQEAKNIYSDRHIFAESEANDAIRAMEIEQTFRRRG